MADYSDDHHPRGPSPSLTNQQFSGFRRLPGQSPYLHSGQLRAPSPIPGQAIRYPLIHQVVPVVGPQPLWRHLPDSGRWAMSSDPVCQPGDIPRGVLSVRVPVEPGWSFRSGVVPLQRSVGEASPSGGRAGSTTGLVRRQPFRNSIVLSKITQYILINISPLVRKVWRVRQSGESAMCARRAGILAKCYRGRCLLLVVTGGRPCMAHQWLRILRIRQS